MTHQQKLEAVRQACTRVNPEIVELKFGCVYRVANRPGTFIVASDHMTDTIKSMEITAIGRPVRLADVLLASKGWIHDIENDGEKLRTYKLHNDGKHDLQVFWNLHKDSLDEQSEETISFLYELLK